MFQCSLLSVFADDEYTYTVTFYAGNQGTFADGAGKIVMSNLKYGAFVSFDVQKDGVVTLNNSDKYYVKGLRKSGRDNSETDELEASRYSVTVKGDADYVVAMESKEIRLLIQSIIRMQMERNCLQAIPIMEMWVTNR